MMKRAVFLVFVFCLFSVAPSYGIPVVDKVMEKLGRHSNQENDEETVGRVYNPPPKEMFDQECEPLRQKIIGLEQKPFYIHPFYKPSIGLTKRKYYHCLSVFEEQERLFLKHAEITPKSPETLPSLKLDPVTKEYIPLKEETPEEGGPQGPPVSNKTPSGTP